MLVSAVGRAVVGRFSWRSHRTPAVPGSWARSRAPSGADDDARTAPANRSNATAVGRGERVSGGGQDGSQGVGQGT